MTKQRVNGVITWSIESFAGRVRAMMLAIAAATIACVVVILNSRQHSRLDDPAKCVRSIENREAR